MSNPRRSVWLRHAHASQSLDRGAPIHLVQQTLGHASVVTTGRYLHARPTDSSARYLMVWGDRSRRSAAECKGHTAKSESSNVDES